MTNSRIEYQIKRKRFFESKSKPDRSFKTLTQKWKAPRISKKKLLPDLTLYPKEWTYLVSNEKHPHTITIEQFRKKELKPGDKVYFERGQIYNWSQYDVTVDNVTVSSYGSGDEPIFMGSNSLSANVWTSETGGYYSTPLATAPLWVVNAAGEMARQGESDWLASTSAPSGTERGFNTATLNAFNSVESLTTAKARFKEFNFRMSYEIGISSYNTGTGVVTFASSITGAGTGYPMKLYGQKQFATLEGDWWYDDANNELWIKTASDPTGTDIRVITENHAFNIDEAENVTISNLELTQYYARAIRTFRATGASIHDLYIHDIRTNGMQLLGNATGMDVYNLDVRRCGLNGLFLGAIQSSTIHDLEIQEIGMQDNYPWPIHTEFRKHGGMSIAVSDEQTEAIHLTNSITLSRWVAHNLAYSGMSVYGDNWIIEDSHVYDYSHRFSDAAGIGSFYASNLGTGSTSDGIIRRCIVHDGIGSHEGIANVTSPEFVMGVYIDNGSNNWLVEDCTLYNNAFAGVYSNWNTEQTTIDGCLIARNGVSTASQGAQIFFFEKPNGTDSPQFTRNKKNVVTNNILVPHTEGQYAIVTISNGTGADANYNPFDTGGSCDNNRYVKIYHTQFGTLFGHSTNNNITAYTGLSFSGWQSRNSVDASSTSMTAYIDYANVDRSEFDIRVISNPTGSSDNIAIPADFMDEDGADLSSPVAVPAYSGQLVLTKASNYYLTDAFNAANGTSLAGRTPTIGPVPTIVAGTHTINSSNLGSSVDGHTRYDLGTPDLIWEMRQSVTSASNGFTINFRAQDNTVSTNNRIAFLMNATTISITQIVGGVSTVLQSASFTVTTSTQYHIKFTFNGSNVRVSVDGVEYINTTTALLTGNFHGIFGSTAKTTYYYTAYKLTAV